MIRRPGGDSRQLVRDKEGHSLVIHHQSNHPPSIAPPSPISLPPLLIPIQRLCNVVSRVPLYNCKMQKLYFCQLQSIFWPGSSVVFHVQFLLIKISQQYNRDCDYPQMHTLNVRWVLRVVLGVGPYLQTPILSFPDYAFTWDLAPGGIALGRDANSYGCLEKATDRLKTQKWSDDDDDPSIDQG